MDDTYTGVITRFLRSDERLVLSEEQEMPLVIEADESKDIGFLNELLKKNSAKILDDMAKYGAVLLRGFDIDSDESFENAILSIQGFRGISDAFMSEEGRVHPGKLKFVLHTNAVYKTGGTLYLGGFHTENYYSPDVPSYICFCCLRPSATGGETGLINTEKLYSLLDDSVRKKLEKNTFFVKKWLVSDVAERYQISEEDVGKIGQYFDLPSTGMEHEKFVLMYKPSVFEHPVTQKKTLQLNLFELPTLNTELRKQFMRDYQGSAWFWHRFVWKLPESVLKILEIFYLMFASFFYSPKDSLKILKSKIKVFLASRHQKPHLTDFNQVKAGTCFDDQEVKDLAGLMRTLYSSCLWKKGDILLIDNRKVMHAGMPGTGPRLVRAMIGNPIDIPCAYREPGYTDCKERATGSIGSYITSKRFETREGCGTPH